jgi:hypothetical protein
MIGRQGRGRLTGTAHPPCQRDALEGRPSFLARIVSAIS